jgi:hypothetical protein
MLVIPNLNATPFHRIRAGVSVRLDQLSESDYESYAPFENAITAQISGEKSVFATLETAEDPDSVNAWLSWSSCEPPLRPELTELAQQPDSTLNFSLDKWRESDSDSIWNELGVFLDKTVDLFVNASFSVDRERLPSESLVASMIGLRTTAGEEQFLLSGAQFTVRGFPEDKISWYLKSGLNGQMIAGDVTRSWVEKFHPESIHNAVHVIEARFNRIVRAQSNVRAHAAS